MDFQSTLRIKRTQESNASFQRREKIILISSNILRTWTQSDENPRMQKNILFYSVYLV